MSDTVSIHNLLQLATNLNPLKSLKLESAKEEEVSGLIVGILGTVDFKQGVEAMMNLLQTVRAQFGNCEKVLEAIVKIRLKVLTKF